MLHAASSKISVIFAKYKLDWDHSSKVLTGLALVAVTRRLVAVLLAASLISKRCAACAALKAVFFVHCRHGGGPLAATHSVAGCCHLKLLFKLTYKQLFKLTLPPTA
jgi:hypothetical protein